MGPNFLSHGFGYKVGMRYMAHYLILTLPTYLKYLSEPGFSPCVAQRVVGICVDCHLASPFGAQHLTRLKDGQR